MNLFLSISEMAGGIEPAAERPSLLRAMPISVSQAQKVCGKLADSLESKNSYQY